MLVHDRSWGDRRGWWSWPAWHSCSQSKCRHDHLWGWRAVAERGVRAHRVVVPPPALDHDLRLAQAVEDLAVQQLVPEPGIEALDEAVIGAAVARHAAQDEEVGEDIDHVRGLELASDPNRQALVRELVDDVEHAVLPSVMGAVLDEVVGPDMVGALGPQAEAGAVRQPEPPALGLLFGDLQPLAAPDPLHPLVVDHPAGCGSQQLGDLAVAIAAVLARELDDVGGEPFLVVPAPPEIFLRPAVLAAGGPRA